MAEPEVFASKPAPGKPWDVIILGSGPASLTAAVYTTRGAASTLIVGGEAWGGQLMLTTTVDNWPGTPGIQGPDLMQKLREHSLMFGAQFVGENATGIDVGKKPFEVSAGGTKYLARSVIVATGADTKWLDAPGIKEYIGRGVSSCAPCDAPFFKGKKVAVVGGGDSAMEEALTLSKYVTEVAIIHRGDAFRASAAMQKKVLADPKIKVLWNTEVKEVIGNQKVEKVVVVDNKTNQTSELILDGIFIAIGHVPATSIFSGKIELDERGYVKIFDHTRTSVPGIFVAGDVHDYLYKQAVTAAGFGCMAAMETIKYLEEVKAGG
ncbi:MAG: Thioredoxin-disulfide reductase [Candidatus Woesebacteria bacterium GW2011_GWC2_47_16]|uniref:Thioredoxin reductase n=3 Tax=Candidatus Woeseibacteriota TaxID=1752722 RepID=A0A1F8D552_9BACT|nr:MAG: Thioredoxin-disulfide reductase [Candidatus Woesebacteria bacterium GW2011_GWE1_45_18]KKU63730.1 MAG: Thioredoxin-disulfide reductase [Candidatus Woesebacteria bacterium GW2011_GWC2_47_16]OGM83632.1 MAG: thioredoxin-disulfide reductase [Candidatus Woesebacteria bacterium RIFOXYB1_FULL_47_31]